MLYCKYCGEMFHAYDARVEKGYFVPGYGDYESFYADPYYKCPYCGSSRVEEARRCTCCGEYFVRRVTEDDPWEYSNFISDWGTCEECREEIDECILGLLKYFKTKNPKEKSTCIMQEIVDRMEHRDWYEKDAKKIEEEFNVHFGDLQKADGRISSRTGEGIVGDLSGYRQFPHIQG